MIYRSGYGSPTDYERLSLWHSATGAIIGTERAAGATNSMPLFLNVDGSWGMRINPNRSVNFSSSIVGVDQVNANGTITSGNSLVAGASYYAGVNGRALIASPSQQNIILSGWSKNVNFLGFSHVHTAFTETNTGIYVGDGNISFTTGTNTSGSLKSVTFDSVNRTNWLGGVTTITNLTHGTIDATHTYVPTTTNLVWYIDLSLPAQTIDITNVGLASITFHTTNRPSTTNAMRSSVVRIRQTATNSLPVTFNSCGACCQLAAGEPTKPTS
jgi:hypothetical protein